MYLIESLIGSPQVWSEEQELMPALVTYEREGKYRLGTPVIINRKEYEEKLKGYESKSLLSSKADVHSILYFPQGRLIYPRKVIGLPAVNLRPMEPKNLIVNRRLLEIETFDFNKLDRIIELTDAEAAITFVIKDHNGMLKFLDNCSESICKKFKYTSPIFTAGGEDIPSKTEILLQISFYSLPYAIPTFTRRRGTGLAINFGIMYNTMNDYSSAKIIREQFSLMSTDGSIHVVDGIVIRSSGFVSKDNISYMKGIAEMHKTHHEKPIKSKLKEPPAKSNMDVKSSVKIRGTYAGTTYYTSTSTTTTW